MPEARFNKVKRKLIRWYNDNKRDLPWRNIKDPYNIWLSEIILQQTRVEQGLPYYNAFVNKYPDIEKLALAPIDEVLKLWQGLGYYSRANNMHATAKKISHNFNGEFPKDYNDILKLKGVGKYTAAAIASFAYNQPYAVVDGNVIRFISRYMGIEGDVSENKTIKLIEQFAYEMLDRKNPGVYNQAIMEFGATWCKPKHPKCTECIFKVDCIAFANNMVQKLPVKQKKLKKVNRYFNYLILKYKNEILINKRSQTDIWRGLYDFLLHEHNEKLAPEDFLKEDFLLKLRGDRNFTHISYSKEYKHVLSHQNIFCRFYMINLESKPEFSKKGLKWVPFSKLETYAVPALLELFMKKSKEWKQFIEHFMN